MATKSPAARKSPKKGQSPIGKVKKGALRKSLGMSTTKDMPESAKVIHKGDSKIMKKRKVFAQNAKKWHHGGS